MLFNLASAVLIDSICFRFFSLVTDCNDFFQNRPLRCEILQTLRSSMSFQVKLSASFEFITADICRCCFVVKRNRFVHCSLRFYYWNVSSKFSKMRVFADQSSRRSSVELRSNFLVALRIIITTSSLLSILVALRRPIVRVRLVQGSCRIGRTPRARSVQKFRSSAAQRCLRIRSWFFAGKHNSIRSGVVLRLVERASLCELPDFFPFEI